MKAVVVAAMTVSKERKKRVEEGKDVLSSMQHEVCTYLRDRERQRSSANMKMKMSIHSGIDEDGEGIHERVLELIDYILIDRNEIENKCA